MTELKVLGKKEIAGKTFTGIEGGFGEGKKSMLVRDIATNHGKQVKHVNSRINENRKRFKDGVDIIDLLGVGLTDPEIIAFGFTQQAINSYRGQDGNIYILSERGYAKLLKILEDDLAWQLYDEFVDGYFNMRAEKKQDAPSTLEDIMIHQLHSMKEVKQRVIKLETDLSQMKESLARPVESKYNLSIDDTLYTAEFIADELGISSARALNNILNDLGVQYHQKGEPASTDLNFSYPYQILRIL